MGKKNLERGVKKFWSGAGTFLWGVRKRAEEYLGFERSLGVKERGKTRRKMERV